MAKPVPKSRLNIKYRTTIDGVVKQQTLPFRLLVLGDFTGYHATGVPDREVHSMTAGMKLDDFLEHLSVACPIPTGPLRYQIDGEFTGTISGIVLADEDPQAVQLEIHCTGVVKSQGKDNGLGNCSGTVSFTKKINDATLTSDGDVSFKLDRVKDLTLRSVEGDVTGNVDALSFGEVELTGTPDERRRFEVSIPKLDPATGAPAAGVSKPQAVIHLAIPLRSLRHFTPSHIGASVPEVRRLLLVRRLLREMRTSISDNPALRDTVRGFLEAGDGGEPAALRADYRKKYAMLTIEKEVPDPPLTGDTPYKLEAELAKVVESLVRAVGLDATKIQWKPLVEPIGTDRFRFVDEAMMHDEDRAVNSLAALFANWPEASDGLQVTHGKKLSISVLLVQIDAIVKRIEALVEEHVHAVLRDPQFRALETNWRSLGELHSHVTSEEVVIDFLDITKEELGNDLEDHSSDLLGSALFKKVYISEYDRFGGKPFGAMVALYAFNPLEHGDLSWLRTMSRVCAAAHCPLVTAPKPEFFGCASFADVDKMSDLDQLLSRPKYGLWNAFRGEPDAAYIALALPRYLVRAPWVITSQESDVFPFREVVRSSEDYLWGSAAVPFARNMIRSFENSGWCQHIAGPRGGGLLEDLPVHVLNVHGREEVQPPVDSSIPDYRELEYARNGMIALVHKQDSNHATFFSSQSIKRPIEFEDEVDTQNADLVCNFAYTLSVTRIAHYVKRMVRDYIGSTADGPYIQNYLEMWLVNYVTTTVNPDDLTLLYYPFKAISVQVEPKPGPLGWYNATISILPHIMFQGMDAELRLEAALG